MGVQSFIRAALKSSLTKLEAEDVTIGSETASAIIDTDTQSLDLDIGGDNLPRELRCTFAADAFSATIKSGMRATARGLTWKIADVEKGQAGLHLTLQEPDKRTR